MRAALSVLTGLAASLAVQAATFTVTSTADSGAGTLRQAILDANANPGPDTIEFDTAGSFATAQTIVVDFPPLEITDELVVNGPGADDQGVTLDGQGTDALLKVTGSGAGEVSLSHLDFFDGYYLRAPGDDAVAGGLTIEGNTTRVAVRHATFESNSVAVTWDVGQFAPPYPAAAIHHLGEELLVEDCLIRDNSSGVGAVLVNSNSAGTFRRCELSGHYCPALKANGVTTMDHCLVTDNRHKYSAVDAGGTLEIRSCAFIDNEAPSTINNWGDWVVGDGGALKFTGSQLTIVNSTFSGNRAQGNGGAIAILQAVGGTGSIEIVNTTITNNTCNSDNDHVDGNGGGIWIRPFDTPTVRLANTIVAGNFDTFVTSGNDGSGTIHADLCGNFVSDGHNLIGDQTGSTGFADGGNGDQVGNASARLDPGLANLADTGGDTMAHDLLPGSPALDAGNNARVTDPPFEGPPYFDQRGKPRLALGGTVDIGAVEFDLPWLVTTPADSGAGSLREAVLAAEAVPASTIEFDPVVFASGETITLTSGQLDITVPMTIRGPEAGVKVSGGNSSRCLTIDLGADGGKVCLERIFLVDGDSGASQNGGGLRIFGAGTEVELRTCGASFNHSDNRGGGIYAEEGTLKLVDSTLSGNSADIHGGGLCLRNGASATLVNVTISGNTAQGSGGGLFSLNSDAYLANVTVTDNVCDLDDSGDGDAGGIRRGNGTGNVTLVNTIVAGNLDTPLNGGSGSIHPDVSGEITTLGHNLIGDHTGAATSFPQSVNSSTPNGNGDYVGDTGSPIAPLLGPLGLNNGPTRNHALQAGSPALNKGDNGIVATPLFPEGVILRDQRGQFRIVEGTTDIGAFESPTGTLVRLAHDDLKASEWNRRQASFRVGRSFTSGDLDAILELRPATTASYPADYALTGGTLSGTTLTVTIPDGQSAVRVTLTPERDSLAEGTELVRFDLLDQVLYDLDSALNNRVSIDLFDDDFVVTNIDDSGPGSLRNALDDLRSGGGGTVTFDTAGVFSTPQTITLASLLVVDAPATIEGPLPADRVTLSGGDLSRILEITSNSGAADLRNLSFRNAAETASPYAGGGALHIDPNTVVTVSNCRFFDNQAGGPGGGAIYNLGTLVLEDCLFDSNEADGLGISDGGAIHNRGVLAVDRCLFTGNSANDEDTFSAADGGAIANSATALIRNSTFSGNYALGEGGAVYTDHSSYLGDFCRMSFCTVTANQSGDDGAGIAGRSDPGSGYDQIELSHCLVAGNSNDGSHPNAPVDLSGEFLSNGHNLIGEIDGSAGITDGVNGDLAGTAAQPLDPRLGSLADNGGAFSTHALLCDSPALDAGAGSGGVAVDQRGFPRPSGGLDDIGAFEATQMLVTTAADDSSPGSLRGALTILNGLGGGCISFDTAGAFASPRILPLASPLVINAPIGILAPASPQQAITLSGGGNSRLFTITSSGEGVVLMENLTLADGGSLASGGAVLVQNPASLRISRCTVRDCGSATDGGALASLSSAVVDVHNSTFSGNRARDSGGALFSAGTGTIRAVNCTLSENRADNNADGAGDGGGAGGNVRLLNSIVAGNLDLSPGGADSPDVAGAVSSLGNNLIGNGTGVSAFPAGLPNPNDDFVGSTAAPINPYLDPLAHHGGPTETYGLLCGSLAHDAGSNAVASPSATDQRGLPRRFGPAVDIGATESQHESYEFYRTYAFPQGAPPTDTAADADYDGDHIPNGLEFALGSDPANPLSRPVVSVSPTDTTLVLGFQTRKIVDPTRLRAEQSLDLLDWTSAGINVQNLGDLAPDRDLQVFRVLIPKNGQLRKFARMVYQP